MYALLIYRTPISISIISQQEKLEKLTLNIPFGGDEGQINKAFHDEGHPPFNKKLILPPTHLKRPLSEIVYFLKRNLKKIFLRQVFCIFALELYL